MEKYERGFPRNAIYQELLHLGPEPVDPLDVVSSYASRVSLEIAYAIAFEDGKAALVELITEGRVRYLDPFEEKIIPVLP